MNFQPDLLMPKGKVNDTSGGWMPATPTKPSPIRPSPVPFDMHGDLLQMPSWQSAELPGGYVEGMLGMQNFQTAAHNLNLNGGYYGCSEDLGKRKSMINHIAGSYSQASSSCNNNNTLANFLAMRNASLIGIEQRNQNRRVCTGERFLHSRVNSNWESNLATPSLYTQNHDSYSRLLSRDGSQLQIPPSYIGYTNSNTAGSINTANNNRIPNLSIQDEANWGMSSSGIQVHQNKDYCSSSNQMINGFSMAQTQQCTSTNGLFMHRQPMYNLHSPRTKADLQFAPITVGNKLDNHQFSVELNLPTDDSTFQKQEKCKDTTLPIEGETVEYNCNELLNLVDSSSASVSIPIKENENLDKESNKGIDLNKTPAKTPPKRRKIRPKVIRESKPKSTVKVTTSKNTSSEGNRSGKRKYVRKNIHKEPAIDQQEEAPIEPNAQMSTKLCRRALNFDLEKSIDEFQRTTVDQEEKDQRIPRAINLECNSEVTEICSGTDSFLRTRSAEKVGQSNVIEVENQQRGTGNNLPPLMHQKPTVAFPASKEGFQAENSHVMATKVNGRCAYPCETGSHNDYAPVQRHFHARGSCQNIFHSKTNLKTLGKTSQPLSEGNRQIVSRVLLNSDDLRGSKRDCHTVRQTYPRIINSAASSLLCQGVFLGDTHYHKKMKMNIEDNNEVYANRSSNHFVEAIEVAKRESIAKDVRANTFTVEMNSEKSDSCSGKIHRTEKPSNEINNFISNWPIHTLTAGCNSIRQQISPESHSGIERIGESLQLANFYPLNSLKSNEDQSLQLLTGQRKTASPGKSHVTDTCAISMSIQKQLLATPLSKSISCGAEHITKKQQPPVKKKGRPKKEICPTPIDEIISRLSCLNLCGSNNMLGQEQNALVIYKGDNSIVSYNGFEFIKKRKPRPKVDLDPETNRTWKLLMGVEGKEDLEGKDTDREKWWEEERNVFRGRADSFIARMHLVQGDRRFSRWKGSVVDSVIGVFLTQNVSDHLSSSAFMSLAARFPTKSTSNRTCRTDGTIILVEEPEVCIQNPYETKKWHENIHQPIYCDQSSIISSMEHPKHSETSSTERITMVEVHSQSAEEEVVSSQDSFDSSVIQGSGGIRSYSGSNSETENPSSSCKLANICGSTLTGLLQIDKSSTFQELYTHVDDCSLFDDISNNEIVDNLESSYVFKFTPMKESVSSRVMQLPNVPKLTGETFKIEERTSVMNKQVHPDYKLVESHSKEQANSSVVAPNDSKAKKRKNKGEEKNAADWDHLRKEAQFNGWRNKRSKDAMDSMNYEALRQADVNEIADSIKERGMNNMLAERIKEFLNRLVEEHGSIDLEWLRDVPPEKAKDYLLSVRGLGLKSVECVRLLTLHHLAFPVDTNVGRIAVRLGWVPIQPLPESLQLHLLEMYPVLESIQKYLWPRLCKLDQRTLYELHYQLITFGKVFCTKREPNCNACPIRGDCRHFASAFASARMALPGPEDKSIVSSTTPITAERNPAVPVNPMRLYIPESNSYGGTVTEIGNCQPIIEEPATPEEESRGISESDIEDLFNDDPDGIPTIKLSLEEFTVNIQNYMERNSLELQDGDMSKALIALDPKAASIPMPKLKYVSRLRTEHQVYELPDSHPLLEGMDTREPDDPCPYLLAIWKPGETTNSIQVPEGSGDCQGGRQCSEETCIPCNTRREASSQTIRGTILIPCRTAMRGSFPLNGTYFQVNEVFADHDSSHNPIDVPRAWIWNLRRRIVYFGTSVSTIHRGMSTEEIQISFWRGFVCVRGFDQKLRAPRPLCTSFHLAASKLSKRRN